MTKLVINDGFGGFGLSREAVLLGRELSGDPLWGGPCLKEDLGSEWDYSGDIDDRSDPILIQVVETLGMAASCKGHSRLVIVEVEKGLLYRITEYDGKESVEIKSMDGWELSV